jgi:hypothetical protein
MQSDLLMFELGDAVLRIGLVSVAIRKFVYISYTEKAEHSAGQGASRSGIGRTIC